MAVLGRRLSHCCCCCSGYACGVDSYHPDRLVAGSQPQPDCPGVGPAAVAAADTVGQDTVANGTEKAADTAPEDTERTAEVPEMGSV